MEEIDVFLFRKFHLILTQVYNQVQCHQLICELLNTT